MGLRIEISDHAFQRAKERLFLSRKYFSALVDASFEDWEEYSPLEMQKMGACSLSSVDNYPPFRLKVLSDSEEILMFYLPWTEIQGLCIVAAWNAEDEDCLDIVTVWPFLYPEILERWQRRFDKLGKKFQKQKERWTKRNKIHCVATSEVSVTRERMKRLVSEIREEQKTRLLYQAGEVRRWISQG